MEFLHKDLGHLSGGEIVEVALDTAANVLLMDSSDFNNYRNRRDHGYRGGWKTQSPCRFRVPSSGHWHVTIDLAGGRGTIRTSVRVMR